MTDSYIPIRNKGENDHWKALTDEQTIFHYATTLHHFVHALLTTLPRDYSGYKFPISETHSALGKSLLAILGGAPGCPELALHEFIKPVLLSIPYTEDREDLGKWKDPLECLLAVHFVQQDGNFPQPQNVTSVLAQITYHIRGAMLYEGNIIKEAFNHDLAK